MTQLKLLSLRGSSSFSAFSHSIFVFLVMTVSVAFFCPQAGAQDLGSQLKETLAELKQAKAIVTDLQNLKRQTEEFLAFPEVNVLINAKFPSNTFYDAYFFTSYFQAFFQNYLLTTEKIHTRMTSSGIDLNDYHYTKLVVSASDLRTFYDASKKIEPRTSGFVEYKSLAKKTIYCGDECRWLLITLNQIMATELTPLFNRYEQQISKSEKKLFSLYTLFKQDEKEGQPSSLPEGLAAELEELKLEERIEQEQKKLDDQFIAKKESCEALEQKIADLTAYLGAIEQREKTCKLREANCDKGKLELNEKKTALDAFYKQKCAVTDQAYFDSHAKFRNFNSNNQLTVKKSIFPDDFTNGESKIPANLQSKAPVLLETLLNQEMTAALSARRKENSRRTPNVTVKTKVDSFEPETHFSVKRVGRVTHYILKGTIEIIHESDTCRSFQNGLLSVEFSADGEIRKRGAFVASLQTLLDSTPTLNEQVSQADSKNPNCYLEAEEAGRRAGAAFVLEVKLPERGIISVPDPTVNSLMSSTDSVPAFHY